MKILSFLAALLLSFGVHGAAFQQNLFSTNEQSSAIQALYSLLAPGSNIVMYIDPSGSARD